MNTLRAVLVEAGGQMEFPPHFLTTNFLEIAPNPGIQVRRDGDIVEVNDKGHLTRRGVAAAQQYPIVVESLLIPGHAARVEFRP
jgi:hypothetical protein